MVCILKENNRRIKFKTYTELIELMQKEHNSLSLSPMEFMKSFAKEKGVELPKCFFCERQFLEVLEKNHVIKLKLNFFEKHLRKPYVV